MHLFVIFCFLFIKVDLLMLNERLYCTLEGNLITSKGFKERAKEIINKNNMSELSGINDYMELYIVIKFHEKIFGNKNDKEISCLIKGFTKNIDVFLTDIVNTFNLLEVPYKNIFFESITKYNKKFSSDDFYKLTECSGFDISKLLMVKKLSNEFSVEIVEYMLKHEKIIEKYIYSKFSINEIELWWPEEEISKYYDDLVYNYLTLGKPEIECCRLLLKGERTLNKMNLEILFKIMNYNKHLKEFTINDLDVEKDLNNFLKQRIQILYQLNYKKNMLMKRFLGLYFIDENSRWTVATSKKNNLSLIDYIKPVWDKEYFQSHENKQIEMFQIYLLSLFDEELHKKEDCVEGMIKIMLEEELFEKDFFVNTSNDDMDYLKKCRNILIEIENLLHQYVDYVENGSIDKDRIRFMGEEINASKIKSLHRKKHAYLSKDHYDELSNLFSEQSNFLAAIPKYGDYKSVYETLSKEEVYYESLGNLSKPEMKHLIDDGIVELDKNSFIKINETMLSVLNEIYEYGYINLMYKNQEEKNEILKLEEKGFLFTDDNFFSKQEENYFNFIMNNKNFLNSVSLRNKYVHGTQPSSKEVIKRDYYNSLIIFVLVAFNIFEDFTK